ncbi:MAG: hypothetical protein NZM31_03440 [Gemmatales bacterium]|nr:hypothetical protein [Gemmatales bacterium]MDW8386052.1 hypothetical protein [Gemmatales bacterium]
MIRTGFLAIVSLGTCFIVHTQPAEAQQRATNERIEQAVARGVSYLRSRPWNYNEPDKPSNNFDYDVGAAALIGLALLESGVSPKDPILLSSARAIRSAAPKLKKTYAISLVILFLDRYGGSEESAIIRDLACRLAAGQDNTSWGWTYDCPQVKDTLAILNWLRTNQKKTEFGKYLPTGTACNSNTQFAIMALWVAKRHNVPTDYVLARAEARFRQTQHSDGGWGYRHDTEGSSPAMTCAGLLGLAVGHGNRLAKLQSGGKLVADEDKLKTAPQGRNDLRTDIQLDKAKDYLAKQLKRKPHEIGHWPYFLWSLERVCVVFGINELDGVNWYEWGWKSLVERQRDDGSWDGNYPPQVNTAFALLFLNKVNLSRDLSSIAQSEPEVDRPREDPNKLIREYAVADETRRQEILKILEVTKDPSGSYTQALIDALPLLSEDLKEPVRMTLVKRLARQSVNSLRSRLAENDAEVRLAVVRAVALKQARDLVPDLVELLPKADNNLADAIAKTLQGLTGQDHGRNVQAWRDYLAKQKQ